MPQEGRVESPWSGHRRDGAEWQPPLRTLRLTSSSVPARRTGRSCCRSPNGCERTACEFGSMTGISNLGTASQQRPRTAWSTPTCSCCACRSRRSAQTGPSWNPAPGSLGGRTRRGRGRRTRPKPKGRRDRVQSTRSSPRGAFGFRNRKVSRSRSVFCGAEKRQGPSIRRDLACSHVLGTARMCAVPC